jgi:DNA-directed RNA polymerase beta subunit
LTKTKIDTVLISDITTQSENHSFFIKGGFMTHNSAMGKQAIGVYVTNYDNRMDKTAYVLTYPMRPLVETRVMNIIKLNNIPSGQQVIVAIASHSGYNQEDSLLFNKGAIDRGLFLATIYHTEKDEDKKLFGNEEIRCKPDKNNTKNMKFANYDKLDANGIIKENTLIEDRDIIIGKVLPIKENKNDFTKTVKYSDGSISYRTHEESYIDKNYVESNGDGYNFCKVRIRNFRKPVIGDKFSSRHGQKGTIGNIIPEEDMPFTANGLKPDIIINPHAIPSRMTIGQLMECILGKASATLGGYSDCTPFNKVPYDKICAILEANGLNYTGDEILYSGITGQQMDVKLFFGPTYYQRLKHMVLDKQHCLSSEHDVLTLQGWKPIADITTNDLVATLNASGNIEYKNPTAIHHYPEYNDKMYEIKNANISLNVTDNHRMFVSRACEPEPRSFELVEAKDIIGQEVFYKNMEMIIKKGSVSRKPEPKLLTRIFESSPS